MLKTDLVCILRKICKKSCNNMCILVYCHGSHTIPLRVTVVFGYGYSYLARSLWTGIWANKGSQKMSKERYTAMLLFGGSSTRQILIPCLFHQLSHHHLDE